LAIKHGITLINSPGTVDADYRGEIFVPLVNFGAVNVIITRGMKIAQMVIAKYEAVNWNIVTKLEDTQRGDKGFGSTGV
jgi:dUTP pyrophosphatase